MLEIVGFNARGMLTSCLRLMTSWLAPAHALISIDMISIDSMATVVRAHVPSLKAAALMRQKSFEDP